MRGGMVLLAKSVRGVWQPVLVHSRSILPLVKHFRPRVVPLWAKATFFVRGINGLGARLA